MPSQIEPEYIYATGEQTGPNWGSTSVEYLEGQLRDMEAALDILDGNYDATDLARWDIELDDDHRPDDAQEALYSAHEGQVLDAWRTEVRGLDGELRHLESATLLLAFGGPHVELVIEEQEVRLVRRWWNERSDAVTRTVEHCEIANRYLEAFYMVDVA